MGRSLLLICLLTYSAVSHSQETDYSGIWQDVENSADYYVIREKGDEIVFIALPGVEAYADTLRFSYIGEKSDLIVDSLSGVERSDIYQQLQLQFESPDNGSFYPICDVCLAVTINIIKIF